MKEKLLYSLKSPFQIFLLLTFFSFTHYDSFAAENNCGEIENIEFSNGNSSQAISDGGSYNIGDLPSDFYINLSYSGNVKSVRYFVKNLDTNQEYSKLENFEPYTFPGGNSPWNLGEGTFSIKVKAYKFNYGLGWACDQKTFTITLTANDCSATAGNLHIDASPVTLIDGMATLSASHGEEPYAPEGYSIAYVLTSGTGLVIEQLGSSPSFEVTEAGDYTIHTFVFPSDLDLSGVTPGQTTGFDVNGLLIQGGGSICAALDVAGAPVTVEACSATAGNLHIDSSPVTLIDGMATVSASHGEEPFAPEGYSIAYVLTSGTGLVIEQLGSSPSFDVTESGDYTIHTLVFDANTLDVNIVVPGQTTGFDVNGLLIQGGGSICAALDVAGAPVTVEACSATAGNLHIDASPVTLIEGMATVSASHGEEPYAPEGYSIAYVLTSGTGLVIEQLGSTPSFEVTEAGDYTIHTFVFPSDLDLSGVTPGQTTGFDVNGLLIQGGGSVCGSLDVAGAPVTVEECTASAGNLHIDASPVTLIDGMATVSASHGEEPFAPEGYSIAYVLTSGTGLVIEQLGSSPSFEVTEAGDYTIHTFVFPSDLDLSGVTPGQTTGFDVNGLLIQGGGSICAALDVAGAPVTVEACSATAGNLHIDSSQVTLIDGMATVSASHGEEPFAPEGYSIAYVLTSGAGLVIEQLGSTQSFDVTESGDYTIHTLVFDANTLDVNIVVPGQTTGFDVNGLLIQGGGSICAALDVAGAPVTVEACSATAGNLHIDASPVTLIEGMATVSASHGEEPYAPEGYSIAYVLTSGTGLVIEQLGSTPSFEVTEAGDYTIHTFVFPSDLDLSGVTPGQTTGFDVNGLLIQGGGSVCGSLDVAGAPVTVEECTASAGNLHIDASPVTLIDGMATVSASHGEEPFAPEGYSIAYVLTSGTGLVIEQLGSSPSFEVTEAGDYTIHTFVFPSDLDLSGVTPGQTTGFDVNGLLIQGGGSICAALDVAGAPVTVEAGETCDAFAGTLRPNNIISCLSGGTSTINAYENNAPVIPDGYQQLYVLTNAFDLTILGVSNSPEFNVDHVGFYRIHSLVYSPDTLDLGIVQIGQTTGFDVNGLLQQGGGDICASLDVQGAVFLVLPSWICNWFNYSSYNSRGGDRSGEIEAYISQFENYKAFEASILKDAEPSLYPNPVNDILNVDIKLFDNENMFYTISDLGGRTIQSGSINEMTTRGNIIETSRLSSGTYLINFTSGYRNFVKKIQVSK